MLCWVGAALRCAALCCAVLCVANARKLIAVDLERTVTGVDKAFAEAGTLEQLDMKKVLEAYAHYNPSFGYTQGLSFVVATLIRHTAEVSFGQRYDPDLLRQMDLSELRELALKEGQGGKC